MGDLLREHVMELGAAVGLVGLLLTAASYTAFLADPAFLAWYEAALRGGWNVWVMALGPVMLVAGGWYAGEQILLRRRFEEKIDFQRGSQYRDRIRELEEMAEKLPARYGERLDERAEEFR